jgi:hypothetical protein
MDPLRIGGYCVVVARVAPDERRDGRKDRFGVARRSTPTADNWGQQAQDANSAT